MKKNEYILNCLFHLPLKPFFSAHKPSHIPQMKKKRSKDEGLPPSHKSDQKFFDGGNPFFSLPSFFTGCSCACTQDCLRSPSSFALHFSLIFFQMHFSQKISLVIFFLFAGGLCNSLGRANRVSQAGP